MIFVDSNIPMYMVGAAHPSKDVALALVTQSVASGERLVADAEVLQEILHRYVAINRREIMQQAFDTLIGIVDEIYPIEAADVGRAAALLREHASLSARDGIHAAIMRRHGIDRILSFDAGFDSVGWIRRIGSL